MDFTRVLSGIVDALERDGQPVAIIGAFALHAYGLTRATQDLDFVTDVAAQPGLIRFLESLGYRTLHSSTGYSSHLHADPAFGRVDFVYVSGETCRRLFQGISKRLELGGRMIPVPRPEHLAAMKVHAMKNDPSRRFQDMADIQYLLGLPGIAEQEIRAYFENSGLLHLYDEIKRNA